MFAECATQTLPHRLARRKDERPGRIDIEPVYDPRAKSALANPQYFFSTRDHRVENGVVLVRSQGVNATTGRLVDHEPTLALRDEPPIEIRARLGPFVFRAQ